MDLDGPLVRRPTSHQVGNRWIALDDSIDSASGDTIAVTMSWDETTEDWVLTNPEITTECRFSQCAGQNRVLSTGLYLNSVFVPFQSGRVRIALEIQ